MIQTTKTRLGRRRHRAEASAEPATASATTAEAEAEASPAVDFGSLHDAEQLYRMARDCVRRAVENTTCTKARRRIASVKTHIEERERLLIYLLEDLYGGDYEPQACLTVEPE